MGGDIVEPSTGVRFPANQQFWTGGLLTCLGAGVRVKKVAFVPIKVYAVAMYANADAVSRAARQQHAAESEAAAADVLQHGSFDKVLQMHLVHGVTGRQFTEALDENLRPLMRGEEAVLDQFCAVFAGKHLDKGAAVTLMWRADGPTDVVLRAAGDMAPYAEVRPGATLASPHLGQALWQLYTSPQAPSPDARKAWLAAVRALAMQQQR